jgi:hypothetical protein
MCGGMRKAFCRVEGSATMRDHGVIAGMSGSA